MRTTNERRTSIQNKTEAIGKPALQADDSQGASDAQDEQSGPQTPKDASSAFHSGTFARGGSSLSSSDVTTTSDSSSESENESGATRSSPKESAPPGQENLPLAELSNEDLIKLGAFVDEDGSKQVTFGSPSTKPTAVDGVDAQNAKSTDLLKMRALAESGRRILGVSREDEEKELRELLNQPQPKKDNDAPESSSGDDAAGLLDDDNSDSCLQFTNPEDVRAFAAQRTREHGEVVEDEDGAGGHSDDDENKDPKKRKLGDDPDSYLDGVIPVDEYEDKPDRPTDKIDDDTKIFPVGHIENVISNPACVTVKSDIVNDQQVLDGGSWLCTHDRKLIGAIAEPFGNVETPRYRVVFEDQEDIQKMGLIRGTRVFAVENKSYWVFREFLKVKGYDVSIYDNDHGKDADQDFSDDEAETAFKARNKLKRPKKLLAPQVAFEGNSGGYAQQGPPVYPETMDYGDTAGHGPSSHLSHPANTGHDLPPRPGRGFQNRIWPSVGGPSPSFEEDFGRGFEPRGGRRGRFDRGGRGGRGRGDRGGRGGRGAYDAPHYDSAHQAPPVPPFSHPGPPPSPYPEYASHQPPSYNPEHWHRGGNAWNGYERTPGPYNSGPRPEVSAPAPPYQYGQPYTAPPLANPYGYQYQYGGQGPSPGNYQPQLDYRMGREPHHVGPNGPPLMQSGNSGPPYHPYPPPPSYGHNLFEAPAPYSGGFNHSGPHPGQDRKPFASRDHTQPWNTGYNPVKKSPQQTPPLLYSYPPSNPTPQPRPQSRAPPPASNASIPQVPKRMEWETEQEYWTRRASLANANKRAAEAEMMARKRSRMSE